MSVRARLSAALGAAVVLSAVTLPASAGSDSENRRQLVAEGTAVAFTLRPTYDPGGANPMQLFVGYSEANVSTPEPAADGFASWYNLNIIETAAFKPPEDCTPEKNAEATQQTVADLQSWLTDSIGAAAGALQAQQQPSSPIAPGPRHACTERFPGFAQSRFPSAGTIPQASTDNYFDTPMASNACREDPASSQCNSYKQYWPQFRSVSGKVVRDGSFSARATEAPSQESDALLMGAGDGSIVSIGLARSSTSSRIEGGKFVAEATSTMKDICIVASGVDCTLRIDQMRQYARAEWSLSDMGAKPVVATDTVVTGVHGSGAAQDVRAQDLQADKAALDLGGYFKIAAISKTHTCDDASGTGMTVADAGGIELVGKSGSGGGILIGGACVRGRASWESIEIATTVLGETIAGTPDRTITIPGEAPGIVPPVGPQFGPPRVITREVMRVFYRSPIAWRTFPYWGSMLLVLALASGLGFAYRRTPAVAPFAGALDRFARQFIRG